MPTKVFLAAIKMMLWIDSKYRSEQTFNFSRWKEETSSSGEIDMVLVPQSQDETNHHSGFQR